MMDAPDKTFIGFAARNCETDQGQQWLSVDVMPDGLSFESDQISTGADMAAAGYEIVSIWAFVCRKREMVGRA